MAARERTFGHLDPAIDREAMSRHERAVKEGRPLYEDATTGLWVQTAAALAVRGECCGKGCRHCPYPRIEQQRAGRTKLRPE